MEALLRFAIAAAVCIAYFIPAMMAHANHHRHETAVLLVNILLGWTLLGWVAAMVWSASGTPVAAKPHHAADGIPDSGFCADCGSPLEARASFCPACGYRLAVPART